jgi:hypothetical protein
MTPLTRTPHIHHCTSEPYRFFGRAAELAVLDRPLLGKNPDECHQSPGLVEDALKQVLAKLPLPGRC